MVLGRERLPSLTFSRFYDFLREICSAVRSSATTLSRSLANYERRNGSMVVARSPAAARMVLRARHSDADAIATAAIEVQKTALDVSKLYVCVSQRYLRNLQAHQRGRLFKL